MMKKTVWLLAALAALLLLCVPAGAEEAENLTGQLKIKVVDGGGKVKNITDGKYTTYWSSTKVKEPWAVVSSEKPMYGLYLCFRTLPDSYVIQKESGDGWTTIAEGDTRFYHAWVELDGVKKVRILSTMEKKNALGFNEIFAFGEGETPDWVQKWEPAEDKADILFMATHPDDDLLFMGSPIAWYGVVQQKKVVVAYLTYSNTTRRSEALNGLWTLGIRNYPVFGPFADHYSNGKTTAAKLKAAYNDTTGGKNAVWAWVTGLYRQFQPEVVVTHDENGEYGHAQHIMLADAAVQCFGKSADAGEFPESAERYGTWQVKKLYLHLYGDEGSQTDFDWDRPLEETGGLTLNELSEKAYAMHVTQANSGFKYNGKRVPFSVAEYGVKRYPNNRFGLRSTTVGQDEGKTDFLEHITETGKAIAADGRQDPEETESEPEAETAEATEEETAEATGEETGDEPDAEEQAGTTADDAETETADEPEPETKAAEESGAVPMTRFNDVTAPAWANVTLNEYGFLDEGEYIFCDETEGRYIYVNPRLRVVIERTYEKFEKAQKKDPDQAFYCYTANIWCDTAAGELPFTASSNPEQPRTDPKFISEIASEQKLVFATSTDYYTYRAGRAKEDKSRHVGIEIRNGEILYDDPQIKEEKMPNYETLALYRDGNAGSWPSKEKGAEEYLQEGADQVFTFGPCIVRDGEITEYIATANRSNNPRLAMGVAEPGHYVIVLCEGRVGKSYGMERSTGVMMENLAQMMKDRGCTVAVNMDGGQTAVFTFMGKQLNRVVKTDPKGRKQVEALAFGVSDQVGTFEITGIPFKK